MTKAIVIRAAGDAALTRQIMRGLESTEIRTLRAENAALRRQRAAYWDSKLHALRREYKGRIKSHGRLYNWFWGRVGMALEMRREARG